MNIDGAENAKAEVFLEAFRYAQTASAFAGDANRTNLCPAARDAKPTPRFCAPGGIARFTRRRRSQSASCATEPAPRPAPRT